jgi:hypothetical protein
MSEMAEPPACPMCAAPMVPRVRRSDGLRFWGCSRYPDCHGTREMAAPERESYRWIEPRRRAFAHPGRLVLVCDAIGLVTGLGFIVVGLTVGPSSSSLVGAAILFPVAVSAVMTPFVPRRMANDMALRVALLSILFAFFIIAWGPISNAIGHYLADQIMRSIPTHAATTPSIAP